MLPRTNVAQQVCFTHLINAPACESKRSGRARFAGFPSAAKGV